MGGREFQWHKPLDDKLWVAQLTISNTVGEGPTTPWFRLDVKGRFTPEHHFGIEIWDEPRYIPTPTPIDVFTTMVSVASLFQAHVNTRQVRYHR